MAIQNREEFLNRIAQKLGRERRMSGVTRPVWKHQPQKDVYEGYSQDQLLEVLERHCQAIHTQFKRATMSNLNSRLSKVLDQYQAQTIIRTGDPRFIEYGLDRFFQEAQEKKSLQIHVWNQEEREVNIKVSEKAHVGITISDITLAESATVVLFSEGPKGRSVSLLPTSYIAIIPKSTIVPRFTQAAQEIQCRIERGESIASCINFISGPSNSADIEMNLVVGVHGPVQATYIVVEDI
ncbi:MAG TPA: lactate utilization protein C [Bacillota bacterium]|nr:lactate utilization protein C [Bacillota bacterium]